MKILIVEDEWKTLKGLSNLIAELGGEYEIAGQARSGEEGIRMAMELRPDIIITDIRMNGMSRPADRWRLQELELEGQWMSFRREDYTEGWTLHPL